jgi:hypothetical protein
VPGDTYRNLHIQPHFANQTFKHTLVPVWLLTYTYGRRTFQVVANGHTGALAGDYPKSFWKIAGAVTLALVVLLLVMVVAR